MKKPIIISIIAALALSFPALAGPLDFAARISCELQTASGTSLQRVTWQQGTTPLLSVEQFRLGKAIAADTNTDAVVVIGPSATSQYYVAVTNQSTSGNSYLVQMPTIGTNTASGVWWYTVYFERAGRRYWTGNGALTIEATTSTGDGLVWQTITGVSVAALQSALDAEALARAAGDLVAMTNWQAVVYSLTNGAALGETAWQNPASAADWTWTSNGREITLTGYSGPNDVVIPDMLDGLPVTGFGDIFSSNQDITSVGGAANIKEVGIDAFYDCFALDYVALPACTTVSAGAFYGCANLSSVSLPACTTVGSSAFNLCGALDYVSLPACITVGAGAFSGCGALNSVTFGQNAPAQAANVFLQSTPTIYVSNPHATGWGDTWNGRPVVRAASMADIASHNTDGTAHADIRALIETSIIAPLIASGTNVTVTSTQSVYSVAVTGAGPVGIDWSGLALDGTGRAEVTLRLNVTEWGGTNITFSPSLTFDRTPEILVTGVWEFAASTIDGVTTRVRQTWPECCGWQPVVISAAGVSLAVGTWWQMPVAATNYVYWQAVNQAGLVRMRFGVINNYAVDVDLYSSYAAAGNTTFSALDVFQSKTVSFPLNSPGEYTVSIAVPQPVSPNRGVKIWVAPVGEAVRINNLKHRDFNANERAAYEAGWRP